MRQELDKLLCERYPKMMVNRHAPAQETCMCWGFECGDGWFDILDQLMSQIQHRIDWKNKQRQWVIDHNAMAKAAKEGDFTLFEEHYDYVVVKDHKDELLAKLVQGDLRPVPEEFPQVTLDQVKEKFGTLSFYYTGGDEVIDGMVRMAEGMSGVICEDCGNPGKRRGGGWIRTLCKTHAEVRNIYDDEETV